MRAWQPVLPEGAAFTGLSAAQAHGLWTPRLPTDMPVMTALARRQYETTPVRDGLLVIRHPVAPASVDVDGVRIVTIGETLVCCCRYLGLLDAVILIDAALHFELCTRAELEGIGRRKRRGVVRFREALALADARSESPWETRLRLLHVSAGLSVTPQVEILDEFGRFVARADLVVDATGQIQEYDGAQHRAAEVQRKDLVRDRQLADLDRPRRAYVSRDLLDSPQEVLRPIEAVLGRSLDPWPWVHLLTASLHRGAGRREFERKLGLGPLAWA
ncbi:hypothetical protein [Nocardioides sp. Kera G14]|uniref:hypothetical protein n=1 Tax=Nocardioides sp. Kera G14 TaxID=2884264 RepID=UPI001D13072B|nr:hypothetical protein [Nocardioides sp. Kera G14]UDY23160.1 hypothetical protein LH076_13975 [Nocardioides sp. Kera G14]